MRGLTGPAPPRDVWTLNTEAQPGPPGRVGRARAELAMAPGTPASVYWSAQEPERVGGTTKREGGQGHLGGGLIKPAMRTLQGKTVPRARRCRRHGRREPSEPPAVAVATAAVPAGREAEPGKTAAAKRGEAVKTACPAVPRGLESAGVPVPRAADSGVRPTCTWKERASFGSGRVCSVRASLGRLVSPPSRPVLRSACFISYRKVIE